MGARDDLPPAMIVFLVLNTIAVGLRIYVRTVMTKASSYDDWAMVVAFAGFVVLCSTTFVSIANGYGASDLTNPDYNLLVAAKFFVISTLLYVIIVWIAKISCALVLYRIASTNKPIRRILEVTCGILTVWTIATSVLVGLQCRPLSAAWGETPQTEAVCMNPKVLGDTGYAISAMDIGSSFLFAILPIFLLRGVKLSPKMKVSVIILLGLGIVSSVATVLRLKGLVDVANLKSAVGPEAMNAYLATFVYSIVELGLALFTASLAALRPLIKLIPWGKTEATYGQSKKSRSRDEMGPVIKLNEINDNKSAADSQEYIVPKGRVAKHSHYEVTYTEV